MQKTELLATSNGYFKGIRYGNTVNYLECGLPSYTRTTVLYLAAACCDLATGEIVPGDWIVCPQ